MNEKKPISLNEIIAMLDAGMTRKEINEHFGLNPKEAKVIWSNPKLVNKKPSKYKVGVYLVDDLPSTPDEPNYNAESDYSGELGYDIESELDEEMI